MYVPGRMGYMSRRRGMAPFRGSVLPVLVVVGLFFFFVAGPFLHFFPFVFLFVWMIPLLLMPALGFSARSVAGLWETRSRRLADDERKEKELLEALARHGRISPARVALETTLSVSEADRMLSELAKNGHVEVRAREGRLEYALWERDRRELTE
jgi:hypothetical protein